MIKSQSDDDETPMYASKNGETRREGACDRSVRG